MPFRSQTHVDQPLTNVSLQYRNEEFVASLLAPEVPVKRTTDLFYIYARDFRVPETLRANKARGKEYYFELSTATYVLEKHSLKDYISTEDEDNYDLGTLRVDTTEFLTDRIMSRMELDFFSFMTTTSWSLSVSLAAAAAFTANTTTSNPIPIYDTAATTILGNSGKMPNYGVIGRTGFIGIKNHTSVLDRTKYVTAEMTKEMIAGLMDLEEYHVSTHVNDTSVLGAVSTITTTASDVAFVGWKPANPGPRQPSALYKFSKKGMPQVRRWRDEERDAEAIEVEAEYAFRVSASLCGYVIKDVE